MIKRTAALSRKKEKCKQTSLHERERIPVVCARRTANNTFTLKIAALVWSLITPNG
jgi:hypothetical protein